MCVCCTHLLSFFPLAVALVNDLFLVSRRFCFGNAYDFVFVFVAVCLFLLYALVFYVYCRVLPDVLSLTFFHILQCLTRCSFTDVLSYTAASYQMFFH